MSFRLVVWILVMVLYGASQGCDRPFVEVVEESGGESQRPDDGLLFPVPPTPEVSSKPIIPADESPVCDPRRTPGCEHNVACQSVDDCTESIVWTPQCSELVCVELRARCELVPVQQALFCDDGDLCTESDQCAEGVCEGAPLLCDDGVSCTHDQCETAVGCVNTPQTDACDDGVACTVDSCESLTGCVHVADDTACPDGGPCTFAACEPGTGCVNPPAVGPCEDGDPCTVGDSCEAGECAGGGPLDCEDGDECTADSCDPEWGCLTAPLGPASVSPVQCDCVVGLTRTLGCGRVFAWGDEHVLKADEEPSLLGFWQNTLNWLSESEDCDVVRTSIALVGVSAGDALLTSLEATGLAVTTVPVVFDVAELLATHQIVIYQGLGVGESPFDAAQIAEWIAQGGALMTAVVGLGSPSGPTLPSECGGINEMLSQTGVAYDCSVSPPWSGLTSLAEHPIVHALSPEVIPFMNGRWVVASQGIESQIVARLAQEECPGWTCSPAVEPIACDDEDACTAADVCLLGVCTGTELVVCDDGLECTLDSCHPIQGCVHKPDDSLCDDGDPCTEDSCQGTTGCANEEGKASECPSAPSVAELGVECFEHDVSSGQIALSLDGAYLYVTRHFEGDMLVLDASSLEWVETIPLFAVASPSSPVVSKEGDRIYVIGNVAGAGDGRLAAVDADPSSETFHKVLQIASLSGAKAVYDMAYHPQGDRLYIAGSVAWGGDPLVPAVIEVVLPDLQITAVEVAAEVGSDAYSSSISISSEGDVVVLSIFQDFSGGALAAAFSTAPLALGDYLLADGGYVAGGGTDVLIAASGDETVVWTVQDSPSYHGLQAFDLTEGEPLSQVPEFEEPVSTDLCLSPDGESFFAVYQSYTKNFPIRRFSSASGELTHEFPEVGKFQDCVVSPKGGLLYLVNHQGWICRGLLNSVL